MGLGLFDSCKTSCVKRLDQDGDGKISREEYVIAGKKVAGYMENLLTIATTSAATVGQIWGVDVSKFTEVAELLTEQLQVADSVLNQIKNFPRLPKNSDDLRKAIDADGDGKTSALETSAFLTKVHAAFKQAETYCIEHHLPYAPVKACAETLDKMVKTLEAIQNAAAQANTNVAVRSTLT